MMKQAHYDKWRATVPFTDGQIAAALEDLARSAEPFLAVRYRELAARARLGKVYGSSVRLALPVLITTCALCGKTAHYRTGTEGRCREHRLVPSLPAARRRARVEARAAQSEVNARKFALQEKSRLKAHRLGKFSTNARFR